jgi:dihydroorotase
MSTTISVSSPADFHVHLRQGDLSELVTPHVRKGGFRLAYVMVIFHLKIAMSQRTEVPVSAKSHTTHHHNGSGIGIQIQARED